MTVTGDALVHPPTRPAAARAILSAGFVAGALDLTAACVNVALRGHDPVWVFHSVASGLLGKAAFDGGEATAALGIVCHFLIATMAAAVYFAASRRIPYLVDRPYVAGPLFGIGVYAVMNGVVLPLSAFPFHVRYPPRALAIGLGIHMFLIGLPIALLVRRFSRR